MQYIGIRNRLLGENDLSDEVRAFEKSTDSIWHLRRHVLAPKYSSESIGAESVRLGVMLGLDLLRAWDEAYREISSVHVSAPFLIVETVWLSGLPNAAPPEVYVCLAKDIASFRPLIHDEALPREFDVEEANLKVDLTDMTVKYLSDLDENDGGSWIITMSQPAESTKDR
jgi:hypothetical protein